MAGVSSTRSSTPAAAAASAICVSTVAGAAGWGLNAKEVIPRSAAARTMSACRVASCSSVRRPSAARFWPNPSAVVAGSRSASCGSGPSGPSAAISSMTAVKAATGVVTGVMPYSERSRGVSPSTSGRWWRAVMRWAPDSGIALRVGP